MRPFLKNYCKYFVAILLIKLVSCQSEQKMNEKPSEAHSLVQAQNVELQKKLKTTEENLRTIGLEQQALKRDFNELRDSAVQWKYTALGIEIAMRCRNVQKPACSTFDKTKLYVPADYDQGLQTGHLVCGLKKLPPEIKSKCMSHLKETQTAAAELQIEEILSPLPPPKP